MADEYIKRTLAKAEFTGNFRDEYPTALIHALLDNIPTADVAPVRHGRWINAEDGATTVRLDESGCPVYTCCCSECNDWLTGSDEYAARGRYCPNCGAKMDGEA